MSAVQRRRLLLRPQVALADLEKHAAIGPGTSKLRSSIAPVSELSTMCHADAIGDAHHLVGKRGAARVEHVVHADACQDGALVGAAGGREDLGANASRQCDRRHADAAGARVDQHTDRRP